jgi:hypothetical protein
MEPKAVGTPMTIGSPGLSWACETKGKLIKNAKNIKLKNIPFFITPSSFKKNLEK